MSTENKTVIQKTKPQLYIVIFIISILPPVFMVCFMIYQNFNSPSVITALFMSPVFVYFLRYGYKIFLVIDKNIIISQSGLTIEDYRDNEFKWLDIVDFSTHGFTPETEDKHCFLFLKTNNMETDINDASLTNDPDILEYGIPVCDLARYQTKPDIIKEKIRNGIEMWSENEGGLSC